MTVGVVGLGLIGGSFVKAYHQAGHRVLAWNRSSAILDFAMLNGEVDDVLDRDSVSGCDLILLCVYPEAAIAWLREMAPFIGPGPMVMDCCGTKQVVCAACFPLAEEFGFTFLGGHPMAGTQYSGYRYARANLYRGAPFVIVPPTFDDIELLSRAKELLSPAGFGRFTVTTADKHDESIAFTSQLAHVVSNAYIKSPRAGGHKGLSAGSYKDMTRVAWLNPAMWTELFLENRDYLLQELDQIIASLGEYRDALDRRDGETLECLLEEGKRRKEEVDG
jgi:prephenate dehydrogenase